MLKLSAGLAGLVTLALAAFSALSDNEPGDPVKEPTPSGPRVGAYYYPWYAGDFHEGVDYLRHHLTPKQQPLLGEYDDRTLETLSRHLQWSREAGITLWVASWWGPELREDRTISRILDHPQRDDLELAVFYETEGRTVYFRNYSRVEEDMTHLTRKFFSHPGYMRIDGRAVLFVYLSRGLAHHGTLEDCVGQMRAAVRAAGDSLYVVGDHSFGPPWPDPTLDYLDAITIYDVFGSMGRTGYATQDGVNAFTEKQKAWRELAHERGLAYIPGVTPGYNDRAVRTVKPPLSRKLGPGEPFGSLFRALIRGAVDLTDSRTGDLLMVTSFNEWHEDTQIEPAVTSEDGALPAHEGNAEPGNQLTEGLEYEAYGTRYLEILREEAERSRP